MILHFQKIPTLVKSNQLEILGPQTAVRGIIHQTVFYTISFKEMILSTPQSLKLMMWIDLKKQKIQTKLKAMNFSVLQSTIIACMVKKHIWITNWIVSSKRLGSSALSELMWTKYFYTKTQLCCYIHLWRSLRIVNYMKAPKVTISTVPNTLKRDLLKDTTLLNSVMENAR